VNDLSSYVRGLRGAQDDGGLLYVQSDAGDDAEAGGFPARVYERPENESDEQEGGVSYGLGEEWNGSGV
jgi:hypothetical protein